MNNDINHKIAVMQAAAAGKTIECKAKNYCDSWRAVSAPIWNWDDFDYRVKSEPKVIYVTRYPDGGMSSFNTAAAEKTNADLCRKHCPESVITSERYIQDLDYIP